MAVIDTGMLHEHPRIDGRIIDEVDFTGEGTQDLSGHGTIVTLIGARAAPGVDLVGLLNVKVVGRDNRGTPENLIRGLNWVANYQREHPDVRVTANASIGFYSRRLLGLASCDGKCKVCQAAVRLAQAGVMLSAAVGPFPGKTACPATCGLKRPDVGVAAVTLIGSPAGIGQFGYTVDSLPRPAPLKTDMTAISDQGEADDYMFRLAAEFESRGDEIQAEKVYNHLHRYGSPDASRRAGVALGLRAAARSDYEAAKNLLNEGIGPEVQDPDLRAQSLYALGYIADMRQDASASDYLEKAVQTNHAEFAPLAANLLAKARLAQNAFKESLPYLDIATRSRDAELAASALYNRALAKRRLGMRESSLQDYETVCAVESEVQGKAQLGLASMLAAEGDIQRSLPWLKLASSSADSAIRARAFLALGDICASIGDMDAAAHYYTLTIDCGESDISILANEKLAALK